jgi:hypothetical protein
MKRPEMIPFRWRSSIHERDNTALRIARAYVKLWCIPENSPEASLLIVSIGDPHDLGPEFNFDAVPLFWLSCSIAARKRLSMALVATGSETLCLYSMILSHRHVT